ncbi:MAG: two-component system, OmpR family, operon response regulator KdpE [Acidimicrobiaceae bacterium]|jgi:two-component system KDP operon response regulator KdpE|nr:two-component system, OmpR family, operon response regulator KdpE [Acidimicrobiaceae bacterium]MDQ1416116.1 two-component system, OmpR family, operon response regulator KdpE [Acidimicrobiaceae bacterium]
MRRTLDIGLRARGYEVDVAASGEEALDMAHRHHPDVVILDLGLPGIDGVQVAQRLRAWSTVPIIVLSARGAEAVKVAALDAGADDYVTKPFGMAELLARIRAALRRSDPTGGATSITTEHFTIDLAAQRVVNRQGEVRLSPTQWHLVEVLARHPGQLVTQQQLLGEIWGPGYEGAAHYLRVFMAQIRQKLEPSPARPRYFHTEPGRGYRFQIDEPDPLASSPGVDAPP